MPINDAIFDRLYSSQTASITAYRSTPSDQAERERRDRLYEEKELKQCTFKPKTKWNITKERRKKNAQPASIWDEGDSNDDFLLEAREPVSPPESTSMDNSSKSDVKLVSTEQFKEESGKNKTSPAVIKTY